MKNILVAHDGSKLSEKALKKGFEIAEKFKSDVTVISVVPELYLTELIEMDRLKILDAMTSETKKTLEKIKAKAPELKSIKTILKQGDPAEEIIETAKKIKADLIITGSHGRHGAKKFLMGSVSSKVVDNAHCAVLVVK